MWLRDKLSLPTYTYVDGENVVANTGLAANNGFAGVALYHFADDAAASPSNPPTALAALASAEWGLGGTGSRQVNRQSFKAASAATANVLYVSGTIEVMPISSGRIGNTRQGNTYPPTFGAGLADARSVNNSGDLSADARVRPALIVRLTGTSGLPTLKVRHLNVCYKPAT